VTELAVAVGARVRVKGEGFGESWAGTVEGAWDFLAIRDDVGQLRHVMPDQVVKVLAPPPAPAVEAPSTLRKCKTCGALHDVDVEHCPQPGCRGHLTPGQKVCRACGWKRPVATPAPAVAEAGTGPRCLACGRPSDALLDDVWTRGGNERIYPPICTDCRATRYPDKGAVPLGTVPPPLPPPPAPDPRRLPPGFVAKGETFSRCVTCRRSLRPGRAHTCKPLARSHKTPWTDGLEPSPMSTPAIVAPPKLPFPPEGVEYSIKMANELNASGWTWRLRSARRSDQRRRTHEALGAYRPPSLPVIVEIRRIAWNMVDGHDALPSSAKSVTDQIAEWLGVPDNDPGITWTYSQEVTRERETIDTRKGPVTQCAARCRITIRPRDEEREPWPMFGSQQEEREAREEWVGQHGIGALPPWED
jgi:hypothetical protein